MQTQNTRTAAAADEATGTDTGRTKMAARKRRSDKPYQAQGRYPHRVVFDNEGFLRRNLREQEERRAAAEARLFIGPLRNPRDHFADLDLAEVCTTPGHPRWDEVMLYIERYNAHAAR